MKCCPLSKRRISFYRDVLPKPKSIHKFSWNVGTRSFNTAQKSLKLPQSTWQVYGRGMARGKGGKRKRGDDGRGTWALVFADDENDAPGRVHVPSFPKLTSLLLVSIYFADAVPCAQTSCTTSRTSGAKRTRRHRASTTAQSVRNRQRRSRRSSLTSGGTMTRATTTTTRSTARTTTTMTSSSAAMAIALAA